MSTFDLLPEAVVVVDADGVIRTCNDRAYALLELTSDDVGQPLTKAIELQDDGGTVCDQLLPSNRFGRMAERLLRLHHSDGRLRPVAIAGRYLDDGGAVLTFRNAGRRERIDRLRSDLVATVSHEIRSPLTSVKGFTRTMLIKWERFSDEQKRTMLETINEDADRVTRLLKELLDVSRIDAGRVQLQRQRIDVVGLVKSVVSKAEQRPEGSGREIVVDVDEDLPNVFADPDKIEQIVTNLVENALKYAPESRIDVSVGRTDGMVRIEVADQGPGIPPDQVRRIFEKFGRGRDNRRSGTGLGLYITRGLAEAHGGRVGCESEVGDGSTFWLELPIDAEDVPTV